MYIAPEEHVHERLVSNIRLPTPHIEYVSIRQHMSACVSIAISPCPSPHSPLPRLCLYCCKKKKLESIRCGILKLELEGSSEGKMCAGFLSRVRDELVKRSSHRALIES